MRKINLFLTIIGCLCLFTSCTKGEDKEKPVNEYIVKFWNEDRLLYAEFVKDGDCTEYNGPDVTKPSKVDEYLATSYTFKGWGEEYTSPIKADTDFHAHFSESIYYKEEIQNINGEEDLCKYLIANGHKEQGYFNNEYLDEYRVFFDNGYYIAWESKHSRLHCCYYSKTDVYGFYFKYKNLNCCTGFSSINGNYETISGAKISNHYAKTFYNQEGRISVDNKKLIQLAENCKDYVLSLGYGLIY